MNFTVSVIVPTFNRAGLLKTTLEAVLAQTVKPVEIFVVDDRSSDDTAGVVASLGSAVQLVQKPENRGKAHSINLAMTMVRHEAIWIVDDDDIVVEDALERLVGLLAGAPDAGFAYGRHDRFRETDAGLRESLGTGYWHDCAPEKFLTATLEDFFVHQPGMIARRESLRRAGPVNEALARSQDYDLLIRLARTSSCVSTQDVVFHQRQHDGDRGIGKDRFSANDRDTKWISFDQTIFRKLHEDMKLDEFLPGSQSITTDADQRRALIQRGVIMARKKLWDLAIQDFSTAAQTSDGDLSEAERDTLRRAFGSKYGCHEIIEAGDLARQIRTVRKAGPRGPAVVKSLARGLRWRIREAFAAHDSRSALLYARRYADLNH